MVSRWIVHGDFTAYTVPESTRDHEVRREPLQRSTGPTAISPVKGPDVPGVCTDERDYPESAEPVYGITEDFPASGLKDCGPVPLEGTGPQLLITQRRSALRGLWWLPRLRWLGRGAALLAVMGVLRLLGIRGLLRGTGLLIAGLLALLRVSRLLVLAGLRLVPTLLGVAVLRLLGVGLLRVTVLRLLGTR